MIKFLKKLLKSIVLGDPFGLSKYKRKVTWGCPLPRNRGIWLGLPADDRSEPDFLPPDDPLDLRSAEDPWLDFRLLPDSVVPNNLVCSAAKSSICRNSCSCSPENFPGTASFIRATERFGRNSFSSSSSEMTSSPSDTSWMESSWRLLGRRLWLRRRLGRNSKLPQLSPR